MTELKKDVKPLIVQLFPEDWDVIETSSGIYKTECPYCGLQGGRTQGFIIDPKFNSWYCHSSGKHGGMLELVAILNKIIICNDCCETGEKKIILQGNLFKQTLDFLKNNYTEQIYENVCNFIKLKKSIQIPGNDRLVSNFANDLAKIFKQKMILFYRSDIKEIVEIGKDNRQNEEIDNNFIILKSPRFVTLIEMFFKPWSEFYTKTGNKVIVNKSINSATANLVLVSPNFQDQMPIIQRILPVQIPMLYDNQLTFPKPGYDKRFKTWLPFNAPSITNNEMNLKEAKDIINTIYSGFCFQSEQDKTNAIAALITPYLKGLFTKFNVRTPIFFYVANRERAGKDYCAGVTGIVYEGQAIEENPISNNEKGGNSNDELRKNITSAMIQGRKRFHSSNNKGLINNAVFESASTNSVWTDRILGKNEKVIFSNELDFSMSGNIGTKLTPDLANRSLYINLFLEIEDANKRTFEIPDLHGWVLNNRNLILSAIYCLIKNWISKGCPDGSVPFASFQEWAKICGGVMETANLGNPCKKSKETFSISMDDETEDMKQLFNLCYERKPNEWLGKHDIIEEIKDSKEEIFSYIDWDKMPDQVKFAKKIEKFVGRILDDIKFEAQDLTIRSSRRKYRFIKIFGENYKVKPLKPLEIEDIEPVPSFGKVGKIGKVCNTPENAYIKRIEGVGQTLPNLPTLPISKKPKTDREVQFYEADECKDIKPNHTKDDVIFWLKDNPGQTVEQIFKRFGLGSLKFRNELMEEDVIIKEGDRYFIK
jgi:hypothetical protein